MPRISRQDAPQTTNGVRGRSKYGAVRTNGYASKAEANYAATLKVLEQAGKVRNIREQVRYELLPAAPELGYKRPLVYVLDFAYEEDHGEAFGKDRWRPHTVDVKGYATKEYKIKKRLAHQLLGLVIEEER